jgi:hypothetical protein
MIIGNFANINLHGIHCNDGKFIGWAKEMGAFQTHILHFATCYVLWVDKGIHSSLNLKLE